MTFKVKSKKKITPEISPRKLAFLIKDERKASAEYKKLGLPNLAKDEHRHYLYLKSLKKKAKLI